MNFFLEWMRQKIGDNENPQDEYEEGYLDALKDVHTEVQYGKFQDIVYVKLKKEYSIKGLNHNDEYESWSVYGGEYFEILNEEVGDTQYYERYKFDILKVYNPYKEQYFTKEDIEKLNIKKR